MSQLKATFMEDIKTAMKAHDSEKLNTIRFLLSELKNFEIDNGVQDDAGVTKIIAREVKKQKDALNDFKNAGRTDLVEEVEKKILVMEAYLPQQMSDEELRSHVKEVVALEEKKDFGTVMKAVMARTQGKADGSRVSTMVKEELGA